MRHDSHYVDQLTSPATVPIVRMIPIGEIESTRPPSGALGELTASIARHGVLQPLLVRPRGAHYEVIAGISRLAAARIARLTEVPCFVLTLDDAHARALADAAGVSTGRPEPPAPRVTEQPQPSLPPALAKELRDALDGVTSCLNLLPPGGSLRERVAVELTQAEADRAAWLILAAEAVGEEPILENKRLNVGELLIDLAARIDSANRLAGTNIAAQSQPGCDIRGDGKLISIGLTAGIRAMQSLAGHVREKTLHARATAPTGLSSVLVELRVEGMTMPATKLGRLFDPAWTDRPGGFASGLAFVAARRIAEMQRGTVEATADEGGVTLTFAFPKA